MNESRKRKRKPDTPSKSPEEWLAIKPIFKKSYIEDDLKIQDVVQRLKDDYGIGVS
jgi:hypothetical protein